MGRLQAQVAGTPAPRCFEVSVRCPALPRSGRPPGLGPTGCARIASGPATEPDSQPSRPRAAGIAASAWICPSGVRTCTPQSRGSRTGGQCRAAVKREGIFYRGLTRDSVEQTTKHGRQRTGLSLSENGDEHRILLGAARFPGTFRVGRIYLRPPLRVGRNRQAEP